MADVTKAIEPKSDQMNAEDLLGGARTFTITKVAVRDSPDQPISVWLEEFPQDRPWKPAKTMAKLMRLAWSAESDNWMGNRVTLYTDPEIMFGPNKMGGIRISHMSGIGGKQLSVALATTRGRRQRYVVDPLPDVAPVRPALSLAEQAEAAVSWWAKHQITEQQLIDWTAQPVGRWTADTLDRLRSLGRSLARGETTVQEAFGVPDPVSVPAGPSLADVPTSELSDAEQAEAYEREQEARKAR